VIFRLGQTRLQVALALHGLEISRHLLFGVLPLELVAELVGVHAEATTPAILH